MEPGTESLEIVHLMSSEGPVSRSTSIEKVMGKIRKKRAAMKVLVEANLDCNIRAWLAWDRYLAKNLSTNFIFLAVRGGGKIMFGDCSIQQMRGFKLCSKPNSDVERSIGREDARIPVSHIGFKSLETEGCKGISQNFSVSSIGGNNCKKMASLNSMSTIRRELPESTLGWPLQRGTFSLSQEAINTSEAREVSVVEWVIPSRSSQPVTLQNQNGFRSEESKISFRIGTDNSFCKDRRIKATSMPEISINQVEHFHSSSKRKDENFGLELQVSASPVSLPATEAVKSTPGWPLLLIKTPGTSCYSSESENSEASLFRCSLSLPDESTPATPESQIDLIFKQTTNSDENEIYYDEDKHNKTVLEAPEKLLKNLELVPELNSSTCKLFSYDMLNRATNQFSSDNFIGEGGCSNVYKGCLPGGKLVAIKILKQYKEAWNDFSLEVDIMASLDHKYITPLVGVCTEDNHLMLVYDFLSSGSLEERLQDYTKNGYTLPWKTRFKVAVAVAEALNYLHSGCSWPVIHRDVKSSNILLSSEFQPQLSDFGLAIRRSSKSTYEIRTDVVGTFGYIAPEYFMQGRVSEKIDVYSYGVVLLELLSGRKAISSKGMKGQESLVKRATPLLEKGDLKSLLDSKLAGDVDIVEMRRMAVAATLCIKQSPRLRPNISQVLKLLNVEEDIRIWVNEYVNGLLDSNEHELELDDRTSELSLPKTYSDFSILDLDDQSTSETSALQKTSETSAPKTTVNNMAQKRRLKLKDYLKEPLA